MPTDSLILALAVLAMFVVFGLALAWADSRTRGMPPTR
jgi:ABC-type Fe3+ transport system permease subunit